jgi:hypothetical protein
LDLINDFFLEANPNPERKGCPNEGTLKALAEGKLSDSDPARLHLAACSECYAEFRGYQNEHQRAVKARRQALRWSTAASLILVCGLGEWGYLHRRPAQNQSVLVAVSNVPRDAQVDLFNSGTLRGASDETNELQQVSLPASIVNLHVTLPRFSQTGRYEVLVSKGKGGSQVVARGTGDAAEIAGKVSVKVTLDLRAAKAGEYFLATVRWADNGMYYYPLKINSVSQ